MDLKLVLPDVMFEEIKKIIKNNDNDTSKVAYETVKTKLQNKVMIFSLFLRNEEASPIIK